MPPIRISPSLSIPEHAVSMEFVRASGPGGQNVNKVATAVQLRCNLAESGLPDAVLSRLRAQAGRRVTSEGVLLIEARRHRTQERNRQDAIARLVRMVQDAATPPKRRKKTRRTRASVERRLSAKKRRGETKRLRRGPGDD